LHFVVLGDVNAGVFVEQVSSEGEIQFGVRL